MKFKFNRRLLTACAGVAVLVAGLNACKDPNQLTHYLDRDVKDDVFYFVMPDRFHNANPDNDLGDESGSREQHGFDPTDKAWYHGGDIQGLSAKLDYLEEMGITAIWMTPILKNKAVQGQSSAYHGYWTLDFTQIDPHLGSNDDLKALIEDAHSRNIKVFFDIITNHTADVIKYEECHDVSGEYQEGLTSCDYKSLAQIEAGDTFTPFLPAGEEYAKVPEWLNDPAYYHNQGDTTFSGENSVYGDFFGLDDLNTDDPAVVAGMIEIFNNIVSEFKPDGFRIDTVKHVNIEFWQQFSPALEAHAKSVGIPQFFMFGEVYDANPSNLSQFTTKGNLPSVLDFGFQGAVRSVVADQQAPTALRSLFEADDNYNDSDSDASRLMNFIGNHDMGRFGYFLGGEDTPVNLKKTKLAHSMMYFLRGIPVVYYGDEQGFTGDGGDQDSRENMDASVVDSFNDNQLIGTLATTAVDNFDQKHPIYRYLKKLSKVYRSHPVLRSGVQVERFAQADTAGLYVINRVDPTTGETYLIALNNADEVKSIELETQFKGYQVIWGSKKSASVNQGTLSLNVKGLDIVVLKAKGKAEDSPTTGFDIVGINEGDIASGSLQIEALVQGVETLEIPTYKLDFSYRVDGGEAIPIASDLTAPYQLFWDVSQFDDGTRLSLELNLSNRDSQLSSQSIELLVDSRVPSELKIDYQNGNDRSYAYSVNQSGSMQGPLPVSDGIVDLHWGANDQSNLLFFTNFDGEFYTVDQPVLLTRNQVVSMSSESDSGELLAHLYLNNAGELSQDANPVAQSPMVLNPYSGATSPFGDDVNVRGGLNGWGADPVQYLGMGHYKVSLDITSGDLEFKFADSNWSPLNVGGPITEYGLTKSANPSNLVTNIAVGGLTQFNLLTFDQDMDGVVDYILPVLDADFGPLGQAMYMRGDHNGWSADQRLSYWSDGLYRHSVSLAAGAISFKFANADWSLQYSAIDDEVSLDQVAIVSSIESPNDSFEAPAAAKYEISLEPIGADFEMLIEQGALLGEDTPSYARDIFIRGEMNGWAAQTALSYQGLDKYRQVMVIGPDADANGDGVVSFKLADSDWAEINFGGEALDFGSALALIDNGADLSFVTPLSNQVIEFVIDAGNIDSPILTINIIDGLIVHYSRTLSDFEGWGLHVWGDGVAANSIPTWTNPLPFFAEDDFGRYGVIELIDPSLELGFILHAGDEKNSADDLYHVPSSDIEIWINQADGMLYQDKSTAVAAQ
ncbi:hypothetical protein DBZ36_16610 [Alginatibacterium sediminis]|uniref:Glycosyl hydrolase family 13 catalytic domain-containing protein n=1 Tax=Alginatibacterium sediminis TaxID=2164068 RepID=A0A420E7A0_9ALTE|nr:alpha-amylase family glycosyl hydrolase [Alginatibacterium sediminis]RKF14285.1 hypothetical protein DBZ36_16610 [Alginatibacterium sediminis]